MLSRIQSWFCSHLRSVPVACGIVCAYLLMFALGITCPIKFLTGISCPGCGLSRAWFHALTLRFSDAFAYHPLFWLVPIALVLFVMEKRSRACRIAFYTIVAVAFAVYGVRLFDNADTIVVFAPECGAFARAATALLSWIKNIFT